MLMMAPRALPGVALSLCSSGGSRTAFRCPSRLTVRAEAFENRTEHLQHFRRIGR
jgi:hypothetical protein